MAANLSKNGVSLMAAYKEVVDDKSDTNWALFTYDGSSNDIRLADKGDGGLNEMVEELSSGKVMYAFCCVKDPNSGLPKYVLINWTGEGVKDSRKGVYANHVSSMANFLKGAHVTINARAEEDVDPESILARVAKASGVNFDFNREAKDYSHAPSGPVGSVYKKTNAKEEIQKIDKDHFWAQAQGSVYKKTNAKEEIQKTDKDHFWAKAQREEDVRRKENSKRAELERQTRERENREVEERLAKDRERREKESCSQIAQNKSNQRQLEIERSEAKPQQTENQPKENKHYRRTGILFAKSVQEANEAKLLISQRSFNPRDVFNKQDQSYGLDNGQAIKSRPGKLQSPFLSQKPSGGEAPVEPRRLRPVAPVFPETPSLSSALSGGPAERAPSPVINDLPTVSPSPIMQEAPASSVQHTDAAYTEEDYSSDEFDDDDEDDDDDHDAVDASLGGGDEELYEDLYQEAQPVGDYGLETGGQGLCARALYDYQASDDTELSFDADDIITGIERTGEGWWRGYAPSGHYGMFPSNYVELL